MSYISVIVPSWWLIEDGNLINVWYFGLYNENGHWGDLGEEEMLMPGIITMIILLVGASLILFSALSAKRKGDNKVLFSLIGGIVNIAASILFIIAMAIPYESFWLYYHGGFGLILPFVSGALTIICWYSLKRE